MSRWREKLPGWIAASAITITLLSGLDAYMSMIHIQAGVISELNPLMEWLMKKDIQAFIWIKIGLTMLGVLVLCFFHRQRLAQIGLMGLLLVYITLSCWHIYTHLTMF